jgi:hypothetical protein
MLAPPLIKANRIVLSFDADKEQRIPPFTPAGWTSNALT